ncbi:hypothetical protein EW146_g5870 [Bondarzewia mesenterica]|uniref:Zn(2)-C6 fungal-type domain-containing protein n=1 Tax=Bondarzewia mesenterica TaxID=1095465 RepID=A0A4S4LVW6_9AGAM|nr:hypothetical protein EW146_g5870 [Bondarzewia mesenterica]
MSTSQQPEPGPSSSPIVEYRKDGGISRMRSHKGNIPQLPQTKLCPFCPAKFTRTTHLNRHLRNHTNERLYKCNTCTAQFTRSDLLARHKRSCGESHPISRSRRRSCQTCASLKVKCDLRQPCSKCKSRGRDCVYLSEVAQESQESRSGSPARQQDVEPKSAPQGIVCIDASAGFDPWAFSRPSINLLSSAFPELSLIEETSNAINQPLNEANMAQFGLIQRSDSPVSHTRSLPNVDFAASTNTISSYAPSYNRAFTSFVPSETAGPIAGNLSSYSTDMFEPFFRDVFASTNTITEGPASNGSTVPSVPQMAATEPHLDGVSMPQHPISDFFSVGAAEPQPVIDPLDEELMRDLLTNTFPHDAADILQDSVLEPPQVQETPAVPPPPIDFGPPEPTTEELHHYLYVFLTVFLPQMPVVHTPTLRVELKPPVMLRAMQACGALFVRTRTADNFIEKIMATSRNLLVSEFAKDSPDPKHHLHTIITVILLQTIGLFHKDPQQRAASSIYHGMLVLMIRQSGVVNQFKDWTHKPFPSNDQDAVQECWNDWAVHETIKRVFLLAYYHDQTHPIYFSLPASFHSSECQLYLPCDDALWSAPSARVWSQMLLSPSVYGSGTQRMLGVSMPRALAVVGVNGVDPSSSLVGANPVPEHLAEIPPMGHFLLIHAILGMLFSLLKVSESAPPPPNEGEVVNEHVFAIQLALHRWLQLWLRNPESPRPPPPKSTVHGNPSGGCGSDPAFMSDPLPFYWLAQLLLLAYTESLPPFDRQTKSSRAPATSSSSSNFTPPSNHSSPLSSMGSSSSPSSASSGLSGLSRDILAPVFYPVVAAGQADNSSQQFTLVKSWLRHIKLFLRRSQGSPTIVWDELMKIRLRGWQADVTPDKANTEGDDYEEQGLLGFFEEKLKI